MRTKIVPITDRVICINDNNESVCYLVKGDERAMIIDTVNGFEDLREIARGLTDLPLTVVNTHGHLDHIYGNIYFDEAYMSPADFKLADEHFHFPDIVKFMFEAAAKNMKESPYKPCPLIPLEIGQVFDLGGATIEVVDLKGHTPGSVGLLYREGRILISGDGVNRHTWMQLDESLPIDELRSTLIALKNEHGGEFDYILHGHDQRLIDARQVDDMIRGCDELLAGKTENDEDYKWFGGVCKSHAYGKDESGVPMVIVYRPERL